MPRAENIVANTFTDSNGTDRLNITWVSTLKPPDKDAYCAGSRRWKVRALTYDSEQGLIDEDFRADINSIDFAPTSQTRQTHYELPMALIRNKYYIFQVQNSIPSIGGEQGEYLITYASYIHYFGNQSEYSYYLSLYSHVTCILHVYASVYAHMCIHIACMRCM